MKCTIVAVVVALAVAAEAYHGDAHAVSSYAVPLAYSVPQTTVIQQNVAPKYVVSGYEASAYVASPYHYPAAHSYAVPAVSYASHHASHAAVHPVSYAAPAVVHAAPVHVVQKEARYVAANRGAVHEAPLAGHAVNQQSLNLAPAPGTL